MNKSILIYGCYDSMNLGDDAMMIGINKFLKLNNKDVIYYNFKNEKYNYFNDDLGKVKYYNRKVPKYKENDIRVIKLIKKIIHYIIEIILPNKELQRCNKVIFMGGGYINSLWSSESKRILHLALVARRNKCKVYFTGQTSGPYNNIIDKICAKLLYNLGEKVIVRETTSFNLLNDYKIKSLTLGVDDFYLYNDDKKPSYLKEKINKYFILNVKNFYNYEEGMNKCVYLAEELYKKTGYTIAIVPFGKGIRQQDFEFSKKISSYLNAKEIKNIIVDINNFNDLIYIFSNTEFTLGMAYHSLVISLFFNKPAIGLYNGEYYKSKITGILEHYNLEENAYNFNYINNDNLKTIVNDIISKINNFNYANVKNKTEEMKDICNKTWNDILED